MDLAADCGGGCDDIITRDHDTRDTGKLETPGLTRGAVMTICAPAHLQRARITRSQPLILIIYLLRVPVIKKKK